ncbi:DNA-protecting protein DprA [candidate division TA06 bacterium]|uniref:DNA-protecting protein DprA n=1 Tax=candidate division TA06 bacterium TaxID=2250710 RepID=A0A933MJR0_UNCT6|nr:DNA-protecting protein DprA [candidate division TA06 bacterium]
MMNSDELWWWLKLKGVPGVGPIRYRLLLNEFGSPRNAFALSQKELCRAEGVDEVTASAIIRSKNDNSFADSQLELAKKHGASVITANDPEFPENLNNFSDAPTLLYVRGSFQPQDRKAVAIVGSRDPSPYGRNVAGNLALELGKAGLTIVSGMARGIDTSAHLGALAAPARTIAVLGCGVDIAYPFENVKLRDRIAAQGAVISEYPLGTEPLAGHFPSRNRIITGLSLGLVAVEARADSGVFSSVRWAADQGRDVFAVPGPVNSATSQGTNQLIKQGAKLVSSARDILEELNLEQKISKKVQELKKTPTAPAPKLDEAEENLYNTLTPEPLHIDSLADIANLKSPELIKALLSLELKGLVKQLPGKMFIRT